MHQIPFSFILSLLLCLNLGCTQEPEPLDSHELFQTEKKAILQVLNDETKAAFSRDYEGWKEKWVHEGYVTKTYMNFTDSSITETLGWQEIDDFVRTYIESHPEPDPLPTPLKEIDLRLYGAGAWVSYEQKDPARGLKRETRLMEKVNGAWKIAGMHTSIYGSEKGH